MWFRGRITGRIISVDNNIKIPYSKPTYKVLIFHCHPNMGKWYKKEKARGYYWTALSLIIGFFQILMIAGLSVFTKNSVFFSFNELLKDCYFLFFSIELLGGIVLDIYFKESWEDAKKKIGPRFLFLPWAFSLIIVFLFLVARLSGIDDSNFYYFLGANFVVFLGSLMYAAKTKSLVFINERRQ